MNGYDYDFSQMPGAVIDTLKADKDSPEVNFRYSANPEQSCGFCVHFSPPGKCEIVLGVVRAVDVCNLFEARPDGGRVTAELAHDEFTGAEPFSAAGDQSPDQVRPVQAQVQLHVPQRVAVQSEYKPRQVQAELVGRGPLLDARHQVQATLSEAKPHIDANFSDNHTLPEETEQWVRIKGKSMRKGSVQHKAALAEIDETEKAAPFKPRVHTGRFISQGKTHRAVQATEVAREGGPGSGVYDHKKGTGAEQPKTEGPKLTDTSHQLFMELADDAGNWSGQPLLGGNVSSSKELRGNVTQLKRAGLISTQQDEGQTWVNFSPKGIEYAAQHGKDLSFITRQGGNL